MTRGPAWPGCRETFWGEVRLPGRFRRALGSEPRIEPVGEVWRVGVLLIGDHGVFAEGEIVRATDPGRRGYASESARERAARRQAAIRGGIPEGRTVHIGWEPIDLDALARGEDAGPLTSDAGDILVRWSAAGQPVSLKPYLDERIDLLRDPPASG